ncbi:MAG TPA: helix-turn-helix domain-containing protein [Conexibacter sp.]|nr:helix-turn-helix domain-containing protein [Conexibacter sp.]
MSPLDQRWIKTLSHPSRIAILRHLLADGDATPGTLAAALGLPLATVSYHVRRLHDAQQITLVRETPQRGAVAHHYRLRSREATTDALRRIGLPAAPARATDLEPSDPWQKINRAIGELRRRREAQGISRDALARSLRIKPSHLANIERGETDPRSTVLISIAHELGTSLGEIFTVTGS